VVGDGVRLEEGVVRDGAERVVVAAEFLLQRHGLLDAGLFGRRLGAGVEQGGVGGVVGLEAALLHLEETRAALHRVVHGHLN